MCYSIKIPPEQLTNLWQLREHAGRGPIAVQVRRAIQNYIDSQREEVLQVEKVLEQEGQDTESKK